MSSAALKRVVGSDENLSRPVYENVFGRSRGLVKRASLAQQVTCNGVVSRVLRGEIFKRICSMSAFTWSFFDVKTVKKTCQ